MSESKHTALPWQVAEEGGTVIETVTGPPYELVVADTGGPCGAKPWAEANAEFIVRACNAHDDLLKAAQTIVKYARDAHRNNPPSGPIMPHDVEDNPLFDAYFLLEEALAKAEGRTAQSSSSDS